MNIEQLKSRKQEIEKKFNQLAEQATAIEQEKLRLQGEYRTIDGFILEMEEDKPKKKP